MADTFVIVVTRTLDGVEISHEGLTAKQAADVLKKTADFMLIHSEEEKPSGS